MHHDMVVWAPALAGIGIVLTTFAYCALTWKPSPESWARIDAESAKQRAKQAARKQRKMKPQPAMLTCEAPSPDNQLTCDLDIGHWGWHRNAETEWFGDVWDIDHWADTQQAEPIRQEPTVASEAWPFGPYPAPPGWINPKPKREPETPEQVAAMRAQSEAEVPKIVDIKQFKKKKTIGPEPLKFDIGLFGTRRPRKSA